MAKSMKAAAVHAFGKPLKIEEVPIPTPGPGEILVKIVATDVCHTDLHATDGDWPLKPTPFFVPGDEGAGIVAAVGLGATGLKEGDLVGIAWLHDPCGECEFCETGWETLCESQHMSGYTVTGSFPEYAVGAAPGAVGRQFHPLRWRRVPGNRGQNSCTHDDDVSTHRRQRGADAVARRPKHGSGGAGPRNLEVRRGPPCSRASEI